MIINQNNYEEFFLLYVDNELSAADKFAVEQFVQENPDLAIELEMLQQVQLADDGFVFAGKHSLYRTEAAEINLSNHEEKFLLYIDEELGAREKQQVETFVLQHPALQDSFTLIKHTRLEPETVVFENKAILYRNEEKERRIFPISWQRMAVAAALIAVMVSVWLLLPGNKIQPQTLAGLQPTENKTNGDKKDPSPHVMPADVQNAVTQNREQPEKNTASVTNNTIDRTTNTTGATNNMISVDPVINNNDVLAANTQQTKATEPARGETVGSAHNGFETAISSTISVSGDNASVHNTEMAKTVAAPDGSNDLQPAVYKELDTDDEKKSLLLGSLEINKDKLRGFFRKAGSLFRGKARADDEKTESRTSPNTRSLK